MPQNKPWVEVGNEIVMHLLLTFMSIIDPKLLFILIEANFRKCLLHTQLILHTQILFLKPLNYQEYLEQDSASNNVLTNMDNRKD